MTVTAGWDARYLRDTLARSGWGPLDGRSNAGLRTVLGALVGLLPYRSASGAVTVAQIADTAGLTERWVRVKLAELEQLGAIEWRRGWLDHGRPRPGWVRIVKTRLVEWIELARGVIASRRAARAAATASRVARMGAPTITRKRRNPLSARAEVTTYLPPEGSSTRAAAAGARPQQATRTEQPFDTGPKRSAAEAGFAALRAAMRKAIR